MRNAKRFAGELEFLNDFAHTIDNPYRQSRFLESSFDAPVWNLRTGISPLQPIDFRVRLDDGFLLTDAKHRDMLEVFKCWICVHDHPNVSGGRLNSAMTARHKILGTVHLIDYLLLNARQFKLTRHGLMAMSANDIRGLVLDLGSGSSIHETLYGWTKRASFFLRKQGSLLEHQYVVDLVASVPELAIPFKYDCELGLDEQELVRARAWLWTHGYYLRAHAGIGHAWMPDMARLSKEFYPDTLNDQKRKKPVLELLLGELDVGFREHERAPVNSRNEDSFPSERTIGVYVSLIRPLELLSLAKLKVPVEMLQAVHEPVANLDFQTRSPGRFRTLPQEVVLNSMRKSVEFLLNSGDIIVNGYLHVMSEWKRSGQPFIVFARSADFGQIVPIELRELGVSCWCVRPLQDGHPGTMKHIPPGEFFKQFRANVGLYELLQVLYGAVLLVLGTLSARRSGELMDLPQNCLDKSGTRLVFFNRKSAEGDMREREDRPIPSVAVSAIGILQRLASELKVMGLLHGPTLLFSAPTRMTGLPLKTAAFGGAYTGRLLDLLCDYIETPLDKLGRRYYIRQHQLRRFFAMLFFWGGAFGGLDTLRWFLGHADVEHLWHYISESIPGAALRNVKAQFAVGEMLHEAPEVEALASLLEERYGTRDFSLLDTDELDQYVEELMLEGVVSVEPEFIEVDGSRSYRILVSVRSRSTMEKRS